MLLDFMDEFQKDKKEKFQLKCFGYAPACGLSLDLAEQYKASIPEGCRYTAFNANLRLLL